METLARAYPPLLEQVTYEQDVRSVSSLIYAAEMLVMNYEQATLAVRKNQTKFIDSLHTILCEYLNSPVL